MIKHSKQDWSVGAMVSVGFMSGLRVDRIELTPGDSKPDVYHLTKVSNGKRYAFRPHYGLEEE